jgi:hypothetical protein
MNILVFAPFGVCENHFDTDLEIAQRHLEEGDRVTVAVCDADLMTCEINPGHDLGRCIRCIGRHREGLSRLSPQAEVVSLVRLSAADRAELRGISTEGMTVDSLRKLSFDNFDAGWAVLSSFITIVRGAGFDFDEHKPSIHAGLVSAMAVYRSMQTMLVDLKIDRVYAFNGRFATMRAVLRAAESKGVDCYIHERGSSFEKYALFENHLPHDIDYYQDLIRQAWSNADPEIREIAGASFYTDRVTGSPGSWISFSGQQQGGLLPAGWQEGRNNVAVFTSSTDENDAYADVLTSNAYSDQYVAMDRIFESLRTDQRTHFYVRIHPRTQEYPEAGAKRLMEMALPNVTVIPAGSPVSTYTLMRRATRALTFGSTTGVEAAYWGVPSILGLRTFYDQLGATYNPKTHDEMVDLLSVDLALKDRQGALMYGYFQKTYGIPFRFYRPLGLFGGAFKGSPIKPHIAFRGAGWLLEHTAARGVGNRIHLKIAERRLLAL